MFFRVLFAVLGLFLALLARANCPLPSGFQAIDPPAQMDDLPFALPDLALLNIWAIWCPPCREEMPLLAEINSEIPVFLLHFGDDNDNSPQFLRDANAAHLPHAIMAESTLEMPIPSLPLTFLLCEGKIWAFRAKKLTAAQREDLFYYKNCFFNTLEKKS